MSNTPSDSVRVRFAPSPTGYLHIGGARTVLFNWLVARRAGGTFILRIEDTDQTRHVEDSVAKILDDLRWLGLQWDEGPEVEGPYGPYYQSRRLDIYERYLQQILQSGHAYYALETPEQLQAMRESAKRDKRNITYVRPNPVPTIAEGLAAKAKGHPVVVRLKMPDRDITVVDDILGDVTVAADQLEDFVIQKSDGFPTYHFACVVDDELMKITHVLRAQEHLMNTPKHIALQWALGFQTPHYGHMPLIFNVDGTKMSKREKEKAIAKGLPPPEIDVHDFRAAGYLPEAVLNFIALLGWSAGDDQEFYTMDELARRFSIDRIGKTNAKFDREKLLSFNTTWAAKLPPERLLAAFKDYMRVNDCPAKLLARAAPSSIPPYQAGTEGGLPDDATLSRILHACAGFRTFADVIKKAGFLFVPDEAIEFDPKAMAKVLEKNNGEGYRMLELILPRLEAQSDWSASALDALIESFCKEQNVGLGAVAQPLRVALTGSTISPAIGLSLELQGRDRARSRIRRCIANSRG